MKTKIIATLLCGMLLTTSLVLAIPSENKLRTDTETRQVSPVSADVPVWHMGNTWTYKVDNISVNFQENNQTIFLTMSIDQLPLTVSSDSGDSYTLSFSTKASGHGIIDVITDQGRLNMQINFNNAAIQGSVIIEKTELGIQSVAATLHGTFHLTIIQWPGGGQPPFSHLPIPVTMNVTLGSSSPIAFLSFPMEVGAVWNLSAADLTVNGEIHSIWLNIIHFINMIMGLFGQNFLPPEIEVLLPVVNIKDALAAFGIGNVFSVPEVPGIFSCENITTVTVPAGTYQAYDISIAQGVGSVFYAPTAGNIIKLKGNFHDLIPYIQDLNMELISTTYQP
jgi:hypothetical protein